MARTPLVAGVVVALKAGSSFRTMAMLVAPRFSSVSAPTICVGVGAVKPVRATREAVTTTSPTAAASSTGPAD